MDAVAKVGLAGRHSGTGYRRIAVAPIAGALGAEIGGVDLSRALDDATVGEIRRALLEFLVIFFRDQRMTPELGAAAGGYAAATGSSEAMAAPVAHPVVKTHPETGRKALYVNPMFTLGLKDFDDAESQPLLEFLYRHAQRPEFTCRFRWTRGAVAFWDNRCLMHFPLNDYPGERRVMHRVTIKGSGRPA